MSQASEEQKEFNEKVIHHIQEDPDFLGHLLEDPEATLEQAGFTTERVEEKDDVVGHLPPGVPPHKFETYYQTCSWLWSGVQWHRR